MLCRELCNRPNTRTEVNSLANDARAWNWPEAAVADVALAMTASAIPLPAICIRLTSSPMARDGAVYPAALLSRLLARAMIMQLHVIPIKALGSTLAVKGGVMNAHMVVELLHANFKTETA